MMKPKGATENECGLLEYLEDIVGTTRYKVTNLVFFSPFGHILNKFRCNIQEPLQKINGRVEILTEESTDKHNRCKMAQREMDDLNEPKDQAIEYINMENERTRTQNLFFQKMMFDKNAQLKDLQEKQSTVETELKEHDEKYAEIKRIRLEKEKLIKEEME